MINIVSYLEQLTRPKYKGHPLKETGNYNFPGWVEINDLLETHINGRFPDRLYQNKYPTEDPYWFDWRKNNHTPITTDPVNDFIKNVTRIFTNSNFAFRLDDDLRDYLNESNWRGMNFWNWYYNYAFRQMFVDPNGMIVTFPVSEDITDTSLQVDVKLFYIPSKRIVDANPLFVSWLSLETVKLKNEQKGKIYWVIDDTWIYKLTQLDIVDKKENYLVEEYYKHDSGSLLSTKLGGFREMRDQLEVCRSFVGAYVPFADDAVLAYSNWKVISAWNAHPIREELADPCDNRGDDDLLCQGGTVLCNNKERQITCERCGGRGYKVALHPGSLKIKFPPESLDNSDILKHPSVSFISPPVEALNHSIESWEKLLDRAEKAINQKFIEESQSGVAKAIDREGQATAIQMISDWVFGHFLPSVIQDISALRFFNADKQIAIIKPTNFKLRSEEDLLMEIKEARGIQPQGVINELVQDYVDKRFGTDERRARKMKLLLLLDPLHLFTAEEKTMMIMDNTATVGEVAVSNRSVEILETIIEDKGEQFLENPIKDWRIEWDKISADTQRNRGIITPITTT